MLLLTASLENNRTAEHMAQSLTNLLLRVPQKARKTVTLDNSGEFYSHHKLPVRAFFCDPHTSWQRGSIKNTNDIIRRNLPGKTNLKQFTKRYVQTITWTCNATPRKYLGYLSPIGVFAKNIDIALEIRRQGCFEKEGL